MRYKDPAGSSAAGASDSLPLGLTLPLEVRVHGRGGQGGVTCAKLIAALFTQMGLHVQTFGDYGSERSGAPVQAYTRVEMEEILIAKLIATSARQIGMFLVILTIVSAAIVAFIIYTMTLGKIREIAVLKLIGTRNRTIAGMILQQALSLGLIGFVVGKIAATIWAPAFPK